MTPMILLSLLACTDGTDTTIDSGDSGTWAGDPVDLLLVIDDSPSMSEEVGAFVDGLGTLVDGLAGRDAQAHVASIDVATWAGAHLGGVNLDATGALGELEDLVESVGTAGSGSEEGLETIFEASCRAGGEVPDACFDNDSALTPVEADTSLDLWREGVTHVAIVLTDEGDFSRRIALGEGEATVYADLFAAFAEPVLATAIGPEIDDGDGSVRCADVTTPSWAAARYRAIAEASGLPYETLTDEQDSGSCDLRIDAALAALVDAL